MRTSVHISAVNEAAYCWLKSQLGETHAFVPVFPPIPGVPPRAIDSNIAKLAIKLTHSLVEFMGFPLLGGMP